MPVVACGKCSAQLKIPDGARGNVKCPKCTNIFPVAAPATPAFEVVDDDPPPSPKPAPKPAASKPATKAAAADEPDFEVLDEKPRKRVVAVSDDDDDKPRKKKSRDDDDDDDDDDRPRSRKRRDEDDDRPRKKGKKKKRVYDDDDDDDDEENWQPRGNRGAFAKGKVGALLLSLSFWLNMAAYGLLALYALIAWLMLLAASSSSPSSRGGRGGGGGGGGDGSFMDMIVLLPGLLGLGAWIVGTIGCSFSIAGPARARGMAITATVFAAIHLILTGVTFSNLQDGLGIVRGLPGVGKVAWIVVASTLPAVDSFLPQLFYNSKGMNGDYVIALLAGVSEILRLTFALLTLRALAAAARDQEAWARAQVGMLSANFVIGGVVVFTLLMAVLLAEGGFKSFETYAHLVCVTVLLTYLAYTAMMFLPATAALVVKDACARRS